MTEDYGDRDLERMLKDIYKPETASPQFKERLRRQLIEAAGRPAPRPLWIRPLVWAPVAAAVALGLIAYFAIASITSPPTVRSGSLQIWVTDDRPAEISSVEVTVSQVQVHVAGDDTADDAGWITVISDNRTFDLIALRDVQEFLGEERLEVGHYTKLRLSVDEVSVDGIDAEIKLPGNELDVVGQFEIKADCTTAITLDFDIDDPNSLVFTGEGKVIFQPVVKPIIGEPCEEPTIPQ